MPAAACALMAVRGPPDARVSAGRCRNQAACGLAHLLALSRRLRRAATIQFRSARATSNVSTCCGRRPSDGRGRRHLDRIFDSASSSRCASSRRRPASRSRCGCKLQYAICEKLCVPAEGRSELDAGGGRASQDAALTAAEGRVPKQAGLGEGGDLAIRSVRREPRSRQASNARWSMSQALPASICSWKDRTSNGRCRCRRRSPARRPDCSALCSMLDGAPTGESYQGAHLTLTAVAPRPVDRGHDPSRLIRPGR